jgi:caffeoyl-CoA O-methyltransferase
VAAEERSSAPGVEVAESHDDITTKKPKKKKSKNKAMSQHAAYGSGSTSQTEKEVGQNDAGDDGEDDQKDALAEGMGSQAEELKASNNNNNNNGSMLDSYAERHSELEPPLLVRLRAATKSAMPEASHMTSGPLQGRLLKQLVALKGVSKILEIGTFCGYSGLCMAEGMLATPGCNTVGGGKNSPSLVTLEIDPDAAKIARDHFAQSPHCTLLDDASRSTSSPPLSSSTAIVDSQKGILVDLRLGPAMEELKAMASKNRSNKKGSGGGGGDDVDARQGGGGSGPFEFVFIDADKRSYKQYYDFLLDPKNLLLAPGALLIADNVLFKGLVLNSEPAAKAAAAKAKKKRNYWQRRHQDIADALHEFNEYAKRDPRTEAVLLPLRDGLTMLRCVS